MCKFSDRIISVKWQDPKAAGNGRISAVLIVSSLWMLLLLITLAFHLNHHGHLDNDPTEPMLLERKSSNISMELSITSQFEELFRLVKHVVSSSKKMGRLEGALSIINRQMNTSVYKRMELDMAMESLKNISVELDCFANWEWNWWPFTYTTTSVCYGRPSDEDWANTKARFEQALWRSNCSAQAVGNLYSDAGEFFLNASSRYADSLAVLKAESLGKLSDSASTSLFDDPFRFHIYFWAERYFTLRETAQEDDETENNECCQFAETFSNITADD